MLLYPERITCSWGWCSPPTGAMDAEATHKTEVKSITNTNLPHLCNGPLAHLCGKQVSTLPRAALAQLGACQKMLYCSLSVPEEFPQGSPAGTQAPWGTLLLAWNRLQLICQSTPALTKKLEFSEHTHNLYEERGQQIILKRTSNREHDTNPDFPWSLCPLSHRSAPLG